MNEKINWEQLIQECNKINKIVNQTDRLNSWKIEYGEIVIYVNSDSLEHTVFNELNKHFPQYILDIQLENIIRIPLKQNNIRKEEKWWTKKNKKKLQQ